jgi:hypothetical protein
MDSKETFNWDLTEKVPLLDSLSLDNFDMDKRSCQRLLEHPHLRNLVLQRVKIMPNAESEFWGACKNLETLSMYNVWFEGSYPPIPTDAVFDRMRTLIMNNVSGVLQSKQLTMVLRCPRLEVFDLTILTFRVGMMIRHPILQDRWSQLDNFNIPWIPQDEEWASILERIGDCVEKYTCLHLNCGTFGPRTLKALDSHLHSLVDLSFTYGDSSLILDVLCSCPTLEILHVPGIFASEITESRPWVCHQLRELKIRILVRETEQDLQPFVFERLSTLVRLTRLDMSYSCRDSSANGVLEFRLDCGLGQLASLQELRTVGFYHGSKVKRSQRLKMKDVEWMIDSWKNLKGIYGHLNRDPEVETQLKDLLKYHGIVHDEYMKRGQVRLHLIE